MKRALGLSLVLVIAMAGTGCAGAHSLIVAPTATVPVSMSQGVRDPNGILVPEEQMEKVGEFSYDYTAWGTLWGEVSLTGEKDISDEINEQVKAAGGEAIVNLSVTSESSGWNAFTFLGVLPAFNPTEVRGDIIKRRSRQAPTSAQTIPEAGR
jgi:hypothetical protein